MLYIIRWYAAPYESCSEPWLGRKPTNNAEKQLTFVVVQPPAKALCTEVGACGRTCFFRGGCVTCPSSCRHWAMRRKSASPCRILSCGCCSQKYALSSWTGFRTIHLQLLSLPSPTLKAQLTKCLWKCYYLLCSLGPGPATRFIIWNRMLCLVL